MSENWTVTDVAERLEEAVDTLKRLPNPKVQGYFSAWPPIVKTIKEKLDECQEFESFRRIPPRPDAISRMNEAIMWSFYLQSKDERNLIWLRANRVPWRLVCGSIGYGRTKAWHMWVVALLKIATRLNAEGKPKRKVDNHE